jgi:hypothetical protein
MSHVLYALHEATLTFDKGKSVAFKVIHAGTGKIVDEGTKANMFKKVKALNKADPGSHTFGWSVSGYHRIGADGTDRHMIRLDPNTGVRQHEHD